MYKAILLSTALTASFALNSQIVRAQTALEEAPEPPAPIDPVETIGGVGTAEVDGEIVIEESTLVVASAGASIFFPGFEVGVILEGVNNTAIIEADAQIVAPSAGSFGIVSIADGSSTTISGSVISNSDDAGGYFLSSGIPSSVVVSDTGVVFTTGDRSPGLQAFEPGHILTVNGRVQTQGIEASGVLVGFGNIAVEVGATGQVLTEGDFAPALSTLVNPTETGFSFTNAGLVQSFGNAAPGIVLATPGSTAQNSGVIATLGDGSSGVLLVQSNVSLTNSGSITASGSSFDANIEELVGLASAGTGTTPTTVPSTGVFIANGGIEVTNSGTITSTNGPAIVTSDAFAAVTNASFFGSGDATLPVVIGNSASGTITGNGVAIRGSALIEQITNAGSIVGDVLLEEGDDSFTLDLATGTVSGIIDGGDGNDAFALLGAGTFDGTTQTGFESLSLSGGEQQLTGDFGTFATVSAGGGTLVSLAADSAIGATSGFAFEAGSILGGTGSLNGDVTSAGLVDPGGAGSLTPGTLTIGGDFSLADGGALIIGISGAEIDMIDVAGAAAIAGSITITPDASTNFGLLPASTTIIRAGSGVTATTLEAQTFNSGVLTLVATPAISGTDLILGLAVTSDFTSIEGLDANGLAIAAALDSGFAGSAPGSDFRAAAGELSPALSAANIDGLSPEFYDVVTRASVLSADLSLAQVFNRIADIPLGAERGLWLALGYEGFDRDGSDVFEYEIDQFNATLGADFEIGSLTLGLAAHYANSDLEVASNLGLDAGELETFGIMGYAGTSNASGFNIEAALGYQFGDADTLRTTALAGAQSQFTADMSADAFFTEARATYLQPLGDHVSVKGSVGLDYITVDGDSFDERGAGALALSVAPQSYDEFAGLVAVDLFVAFGTSQAPIRPYLGGFVRRIFSGEGPVFDASFLGAQPSNFSVEGDFDRTQYGVRAGVRAVILEGRAHLGIEYRGTFSDDNDGQRGAISLAIPF